MAAGRGALADELAAETFATAYANWERLTTRARSALGSTASPRTYSVTTGARSGGSCRRTREPESTPPSRISTIHSIGPRPKQGSQELADALADLGQGERDILLLHAWAGLTNSEIAEALSLPLGTVKSRLHRTRAQLRNRLDPSGQERNEATLLADGER